MIETVTAPNGSSWTASVLVTAGEPPYTNARTSAAPPEIEIVDPPPAGERFESSIAVTSLALFAECPRKYYLARHAGWGAGARRRLDFSLDEDSDSFEPAELPASELGTEVHAVLAEKPGEYGEEALRLARVFRESPLGAQSAAARRIEREWEFIVEIEGVFVRGSIDLWFEDAAGGITIVDYKTDEVTAAEARARAHIYKMQLALYAAAIQRELRTRPVRACLHFLKPDHVEEVDAGPDAIESARQLVRDLRAAQDDLRFNLNEGGHCRSCTYFRELCPASRGADAT
jgi:ATP-dependent helicase/nuclease subunit A